MVRMFDNPLVFTCFLFFTPDVLADPSLQYANPLNHKFNQ